MNKIEGKRNISIGNWIIIVFAAIVILCLVITLMAKSTKLSSEKKAYKECAYIVDIYHDFLVDGICEINEDPNITDVEYQAKVCFFNYCEKKLGTTLLDNAVILTTKMDNANVIPTGFLFKASNNLVVKYDAVSNSVSIYDVI